MRNKIYLFLLCLTGCLKMCIRDRSMILKEGNDIFVNNFEISRGDQSFSLRGRMSENERDSLSVAFHNFNLAEFNGILFDNKLNLFGMVNGKASVQDVYNERLIYANVELSLIHI